MKHIREIRAWQTECVQSIRPEPMGIIQAPGGSGKSLLQCMLAIADIKDTGNKQLILVPQSHIHNSFYHEGSIRFRLPGDREDSVWTVRNNFCAADKDVVRRLKEYLLADVRQLRAAGNLPAITTHQAMMLCWSQLTKAQKLRAIQHITYRVDEAHHISNVFHEADMVGYTHAEQQQIHEAATKLGAFVRYVLQANNPTTKMHLTTATFFRGDKGTIISETFKNKFCHYYLPWDEYYTTLGIEQLYVDFVNYKKDPTKLVLHNVCQEPTERHLILVPALTHKYRVPETHARLLVGLRRHFPADAILDLVDKTTQARHKQLLFKQPEQYHVIVACRLFDEGTDWEICNRLHNTDAGERSLTLATQRFYRPLRQHRDKKMVKILNYIPEFVRGMNRDTQREVLSTRFAASLAAVVTQGELQTIKVVKTVRAHKQYKAYKDRVPMQELYGDDYNTVIEDLLLGYVQVEDKEDAAAIELMVATVIDDHGGVPDGVEYDDLERALLGQVLRIARPKTKPLEADDLACDIDGEAIRRDGFDKVWAREPVKTALCWGTDNINQAMIRELLQTVREVPTLAAIKAGLTAYHERTGKRIVVRLPEGQGNRTVWYPELGRSGTALNQICRKYYNMGLREAFYGPTADPRVMAEEIIMLYHERGIRLAQSDRFLPEINMTAAQLNGRLTTQAVGSSLAQEVHRLLGPASPPLTIPKVKQVIKAYLRRGQSIRSLCQTMDIIPELGVNYRFLRQKLTRKFKVNIASLEQEVAAEIGVTIRRALNSGAGVVVVE